MRRLDPPGAFAILFVLSVASVIAEENAQQPRLRPHRFGALPGLRCEYDVKVEVTCGEHAKNEVIGKAAATVYRLPGALADTAVMTFRYDGLQTQLPILVVQLDDDGRPDFIRPGGSMLTSMSPRALFVGLDTATLTPGAKWQTVETVGGEFSWDTPVDHEVRRDPIEPRLVRLRSAACRDPQSVGPGRGIRLMSWRRELTTDPVNRHISRASIEFMTSPVPDGQRTHQPVTTIEITEKAWRGLTRTEQTSLPSEIEAFRQFFAAADEYERAIHDRKNDLPKHPGPILDAYVQAHPRGILAWTVDPLRRHFQSHIDFIRHFQQQVDEKQRQKEAKRQPSRDRSSGAASTRPNAGP